MKLLQLARMQTCLVGDYSATIGFYGIEGTVPRTGLVIPKNALVFPVVASVESGGKKLPAPDIVDWNCFRSVWNEQEGFKDAPVDGCSYELQFDRRVNPEDPFSYSVASRISGAAGSSVSIEFPYVSVEPAREGFPDKQDLAAIEKLINQRCIGEIIYTDSAGTVFSDGRWGTQLLQAGQGHETGLFEIYNERVRYPKALLGEFAGIPEDLHRFLREHLPEIKAGREEIGIDETLNAAFAAVGSGVANYLSQVAVLR